jgi:peptidyl-prolyl cis-trans isomerase SurA
MGLKQTANGVFARIGVAVILAGSAIAVPALPVHAQSIFSPVARVNDDVVTRFELNQRIALIKMLTPTANAEKEALDKLINERLQLRVARQFGITANPEAIQAGMEEFAARGNLSVPQFQELLAKNGIAVETFRDFVSAGIVWRDVVRGKFARRITITEAEIDRTLALQNARGGARVLMNEIFLPARNPEELARSEPLARQILEIDSIETFNSAARQVSVAPSREKGGATDWVDLSKLPGGLARTFLTMKPGEVTGPFNTGKALGLFQLRTLEETSVPVPRPVSVDYATYRLEGGLAAVANLRAAVDTCNDLYGEAFGKPDGTLQRYVLAPDDIASDIALELARLDAGEVSTALTAEDGQTPLFLMMCGRNYEVTAALSRDDIRARLQNERIGSYANSYLAELRADATIVK